MIRRAWSAGYLGLLTSIACVPEASAQGLLPPSPGVNLPQVSRRMSDAIRDLVEDVAANPAVGQSPAGQYLVRDCQELQRAAGEWFETTRGATDPYQLRRSYSGIDMSWHRLRDQLAAPGIANEAITDEIRRVEQADAAIHQALNLNAIPPNLEGGTAAPSGVDEARRLAYTLAQRGEALASLVQAVYGPNPAAASLVNDAVELARMSDGFSDTINNPQGPPPFEQAQPAFLPIYLKSMTFGVNLDRNPVPPNLRSTWLAYATAINMTRDNLKLTNVNINSIGQPSGPPAVPLPTIPVGQVPQWAETLDRQVDELIANFAPTAVVVPEGREMLGEMERLRNDARNFRREAVRGVDPGRLAFRFRDVDADWQRLARRVNRIARGRTGPNIQRVQEIGQICEQIHQVLGMPGYPPVINPY